MQLPLVEQLQRMSDILVKYMRDELTAEESKELDDWIAASSSNKMVFDELTNPDTLQENMIELYNSKKKVLERIKGMYPEFFKETPVYKMRIWRTVAAASIIFILLSTGAYFWFRDKQEQVATIEKTEERFKNDVAPGSDKAVLTLADNSKIILDNVSNGMVTQQGKTKVVKLANGQLAYNANGKNAKEVLYNTLSTPRGGQHRLLLPDGSSVWLNAASSIRFPTAFIGNERRVEITGEVYFEVAKNAAKPFKVAIQSADGQNRGEVEVLGTHFNINSYEDEVVVKTTLLEGKVKVISKENAVHFLAPGQQTQMEANGEMQVLKDIDVNAAVAWKNGLFEFDKVNIETIMRQVARWYDVEVVYADNNISGSFVGTIPRDVPVSQLLRLLELTEDVHFRIEGKKIVVQH